MPGGRDLWFCLVVKTHSLSGPSIHLTGWVGYGCFGTRFARRGARFVRLFLHALRAEGLRPSTPRASVLQGVMAQRAEGLRPSAPPQAYSASASVSAAE